MDKLTAIKIKYDNGTYSDEIPVSVLSENVEWDSTHTLVDILGSVNVDATGTIQDQISQLFNEKVSNTQMINYVSTNMNTYITTWLNEHVEPTSPIVDDTLSIVGAAADAKQTGLIKETVHKIFYRSINNIEDIFFEKGSLKKGEDDTYYEKSRCRTNIFSPQHDMRIFYNKLDSRSMVYYFNSDGSFDHATNWSTAHTIKAGEIVRIEFSLNPSQNIEHSVDEILSGFEFYIDNFDKNSSDKNLFTNGNFLASAFEYGSLEKGQYDTYNSYRRLRTKNIYYFNENVYIDIKIPGMMFICYYTEDNIDSYSSGLPWHYSGRVTIPKNTYFNLVFDVNLKNSFISKNDLLSYFSVHLESELTDHMIINYNTERSTIWNYKDHLDDISQIRGTITNTGDIDASGSSPNHGVVLYKIPTKGYAYFHYFHPYNTYIAIALHPYLKGNQVQWLESKKVNNYVLLNIPDDTQYISILIRNLHDDGSIIDDESTEDLIKNFEMIFYAKDYINNNAFNLISIGQNYNINDFYYLRNGLLFQTGNNGARFERFVMAPVICKNAKTLTFSAGIRSQEFILMVNFKDEKSNFIPQSETSCSYLTNVEVPKKAVFCYLCIKLSPQGFSTHGKSPFVTDEDREYLLSNLIIKFNDTFNITNNIINNNQEQINILRSAKRYYSTDPQYSKTWPSHNHQNLLCLAHITDVHSDQTRFQRYVDFLNQVDMIDAGIDTGDRFDDPTDLELEAMKPSNFPCNKEIYYAVGNHDMAGPTTRITLTKLYNILGRNTNTGKLYYYVDFNKPQSNIRLICLNQYNTDKQGADFIYTQEQIDWFINILKDAKNKDLSVLVAMHGTESNTIPNDKPFYIEYCQTEGIGSDYRTDTTRMIIEDIVEAWKHGTSLNKQYSILGTNYTVNEDFSGTGNFIAFILGHSHIDRIGYSEHYSDLLQLRCSCGALKTTIGHRKDFTYDTESDIPRIVNTPSEDLFNLYIFDTYHKVVKVIRIGATYNDMLEPRKYAIYNY